MYYLKLKVLHQSWNNETKTTEGLSLQNIPAFKDVYLMYLLHATDYQRLQHVLSQRFKSLKMLGSEVYSSHCYGAVNLHFVCYKTAAQVII